MTVCGFHASHEQVHPRTLLDAVVRAERVGFAAAMSSDHFSPWSARQGQSGFAWSWLGAALQTTRLPFGVVTAPGQRYHPAIIARAVATLGALYPGRFWAALGTGEASNVFGPPVSWDLELPEHFDLVSGHVTPDDVAKVVNVSSDLGRHTAWLAGYAALGFDEIYLHHVGPEQEAFVDAFGHGVLPNLVEEGALSWS